jgi:hypothetical protein
MELISILIILVLLAAGFYVWPRFRLLIQLVSRVRNMQKMADTRRFETPDSPTLKPNIEYCNAWCENGKEVYELTLFDLDGIHDDKPTIPADELDAYMKANGWRQTASRYTTPPFGVTHQFERAR